MKRGYNLSHIFYGVESKTIAAQNYNLYLLHGIIFPKRVDCKIPYIYNSYLHKSLFNSGKTQMAQIELIENWIDKLVLWLTYGKEKFHIGD